VLQDLRWSHPPNAFLILSLLFGTALAAIIPPFQAADEPYHFLRAFQVSEGVFVSRQTDVRGIAVGYFPAGLYRVWLPFSHIGFHPETKTSAAAIRDAMHVRLDDNNRMWITIATTAHYSPVCYLPQAAGIFLGRAIGLPPLGLMYLGRLANVFMWAIAGYLALRLAPGIGRPLFLLLLMPMPLYVAATNSADAPTNALAVLLTALVCHLATSCGQAGFGKMILLALLAIGVCLCKFVYVPLLLLLLLIPREKLGGGKRADAILAIVIAAGALAAGMWIGATSHLESRINLSPSVSAPEQMSFLLHHPLSLFQALLESIRRRGWTYLESYVGLIGWLDQYVPAPLVVIYLIALALACLLQEGKGQLPPAGKSAAVILPAVGASGLAIAILSYLYWTPVGGSYIDGIHGRYFIALSPAVFLLLCALTRQAQISWKNAPKAIDAALPVFSILVCLWFTMQVWLRYYG
jgi:uncharacterized membrane protein